MGGQHHKSRCKQGRGSHAWTVTGCASVGAEITGYSWNGEASAATPPSRTPSPKKGEEFAPILKVSQRRQHRRNSDLSNS